MENFLKEYFIIQIAKSTDSHIWENYKHKNGIVACYENYSDANHAFNKISNKYCKTRIICITDKQIAIFREVRHYE